MLRHFRTYQQSVSFYRRVQTCNSACHLRDQLLRAAASVCLNLAEGYGRETPRDKARFYTIALGSLREVQAIFDLIPSGDNSPELLDQIGGGIYKLIQVTKTKC